MNPIVPLGLTAVCLYSTGHWIGATVIVVWWVLDAFRS